MGDWAGWSQRTAPTHPQSSRLTDVPTPRTPMQRTPQSLTLSEGPPWPFSKTGPAPVLWELPPHPGGAGRSVLCPGWRTQQSGCCFQGQKVRPDSHPRAPGQAGALGVTSPPRSASRPCPNPRFLTGPPGASGIKLVHGNPASVSASREPSLKPSFVPAVAMAPRRRRVLCSPGRSLRLAKPFKPYSVSFVWH